MSNRSITEAWVLENAPFETSLAESDMGGKVFKMLASMRGRGLITMELVPHKCCKRYTAYAIGLTDAGIFAARCQRRHVR